MEMCQTMALPAREAGSVELPLKLDDLHRLFPFDPEAYKRRRSELAQQYIRILDGANLAFDPALRGIAA